MKDLVFTDTHAHLYDAQFDRDREDIIQRCLDAGVTRIFLPNCDLDTIDPMMDMVKKWPGCCFPMMGLHPCSVKEDVKEVLTAMEVYLAEGSFFAIGEIGLDFYWDTRFVKEQVRAFEHQISWALSAELPIVVHTRNSIAEGIEVVTRMQQGSLSGVFHCFSGNLEEAKKIIDLGFSLGIGGVATFKKSGLDILLQEIDLKHIVLETDAPYLAPVPFRGKRNESAYIPLIAQKIADIKSISLETVAAITTGNARALFLKNKTK
jgi:TatD DNase family protein